jgi:hypothetical protein
VAVATDSKRQVFVVLGYLSIAVGAVTLGWGIGKIFMGWMVVDVVFTVLLGFAILALGIVELQIARRLRSRSQI